MIENIMADKQQGESKNKVAEQLLGLRMKGTPLFAPHELGYACPICGASNEVELDFSEYNCYLYCHKCNIDIPSCLCVKYTEPNIGDVELPAREKTLKQIKIFQESLQKALLHQQKNITSNEQK